MTASSFARATPMRIAKAWSVPRVRNALNIKIETSGGRPRRRARLFLLQPPFWVVSDQKLAALLKINFELGMPFQEVPDRGRLSRLVAFPKDRHRINDAILNQQIAGRRNQWCVGLELCADMRFVMIAVENHHDVS